MRKRITSVMLAVGLISAFGVAPAFAITVDTGQGDKQVLNPVNDDGTDNDAHGPVCGDINCPHNGSGVGFQYPAGLADNDLSGGEVEVLDGANLGAWNSVFSNENSAIISP